MGSEICYAAACNLIWRIMMREVVIASAARTAIGSFGGSLAGVSAVELLKIAAHREGL